MLKTNTDEDLRVYAIWFAMYPNDARERWPVEALTDRRVMHYWDEEKTIGRWYGGRLAEIQGQMAPGSKGYEAPILWDAYLVYGPESRWEAEPTGLRRWGRTILATRGALLEAVEELRPSVTVN